MIKKKWFILLALMLFMAVPQSFAKNEIISRVNKTTHQIELRTVITDTECSATAVGPYALLTASHCEEPIDVLLIDDSIEAKVVGLDRDYMDHTIYFLNMKKPFDSWAPVADALPEVGDDVFIIGNPGEDSNVYRRGYVARIFGGKMSLEDLLNGKSPVTQIQYDLNGHQGDSGAAIFDSMTGEITGVLTAMEHQGDPANGVFKLAVGFPLKFSKEDLKQAATFAPPVQTK